MSQSGNNLNSQWPNTDRGFQDQLIYCIWTATCEVVQHGKKGRLRSNDHYPTIYQISGTNGKTLYIRHLTFNSLKYTVLCILNKLSSPQFYLCSYTRLPPTPQQVVLRPQINSDDLAQFCQDKNQSDRTEAGTICQNCTDSDRTDLNTVGLLSCFHLLFLRWLWLWFKAVQTHLIE